MRDNGEFITYFDNGQINLKLNFKDGKKDGEQLSYYEYGQLKSISNLKEGIYDGEQIDYYENGKIAAKGNLKDGKDESAWLYYNENGQLKEGKHFYYYSDDSLKSEYNYKEGRIDGEHISYLENGQVEFKSNYIDGKLIKTTKKILIKKDIEYFNSILEFCFKSKSLEELIIEKDIEGHLIIDFYEYNLDFYIKGEGYIKDEISSEPSKENGFDDELHGMFMNKLIDKINASSESDKFLTIEYTKEFAKKHPDLYNNIPEGYKKY